MLTQLIYRSRSRTSLSPEELNHLGAGSARRNQAQQVNGLLLYDGEYFMQVLEGQDDTVSALFARICKDPRHTDIVLLLRDPIPRTHFGQWRVGTLDVRDDLVPDGSARWAHWCAALGMESHQDHRAARIVEAFVRGRWRDPVPAVAWFGDAAAAAAPPKPLLPSRVPALPTGEARARFALQPIVHTRDCRVTSVEALLRGPQGQSPQEVLAAVPPERLHEFDLLSKADAIALAAALGLPCTLSINLLPKSLVCNTWAVDFLVRQCELHGWPVERLVVEVTEEEAITHVDAFRSAVSRLRAAGMQVAIDDFGAGHAGLSLLADFQPDTLKLDKRIIQGVHTSGPRQAIVRSVIEFCFSLGITVVAEGVETVEEWRWLQAAGVRRFQGYLFARPLLQGVPAVEWPQWGHPDAVPLTTAIAPPDKIHSADRPANGRWAMKNPAGRRESAGLEAA